MRQRFAGGIAGLVPRLRRSEYVGELMPQPFRAGLTFGSRPYGPRSPARSLKKHFQDQPAELQIPFDFAQGRLSAALPGFPVYGALVVAEQAIASEQAIAKTAKRPPASTSAK
jgi:hypothetical protein